MQSVTAAPAVIQRRNCGTAVNAQSIVAAHLANLSCFISAVVWRVASPQLRYAQFWNCRTSLHACRSGTRRVSNLPNNVASFLLAVTPQLRCWPPTTLGQHYHLFVCPRNGVIIFLGSLVVDVSASIASRLVIDVSASIAPRMSFSTAFYRWPRIWSVAMRPGDLSMRIVRM